MASTQEISSEARKIPLDLIAAEILPRLPTKSVLRFKCVCKDWYTLASSPEFAKLHLRLSPLSDTHSQIILNLDNPFERSICKGKGIISLNVHDLRASSQNRAMQLDFPFKSCPLINHGPLIIFGSCNGILCVCRQSHTDNCVGLLNPSTGMFKEICHCDNRLDYALWVTFGFGYDDHLDDYKIVKIDLTSSRKYESSVSVYSLKTKKWRQINDNLPSGGLILDSCGNVLVDNHLLHWIVLKERVKIVWCFNIRLERWVECVPWPKKYGDGEIQNLKAVVLGIVDRCLSLMINEQDNTLALWVMKEHGNKDSWVKLCNFTGISRPRSVQGSVNQIMLAVKESSHHDDTVNGSLCFMSISDDKTARRLDVHGIPYFSQASFCRSSLVAIPG